MAETDVSPAQSTRFRSARFPGVVSGARSGVAPTTPAPVADTETSGTRLRDSSPGGGGSGAGDLGGPGGETGPSDGTSSSVSSPGGTSSTGSRSSSAGGLSLGGLSVSGQGIGSTLGSVAGGLLGGPLGAIAGRALGGFIGGQFDSPAAPGYMGEEAIAASEYAGLATGNSLAHGNQDMGMDAEGIAGANGWADGPGGLAGDPGGISADAGIGNGAEGGYGGDGPGGSPGGGDFGEGDGGYGGSSDGGGWGYGGGDGSDGGGGGGDGGGGGGGWVICTFLKDGGLMPARLYRETAVELRNMNPITLRGYQFWGVPAVRHMRKTPNAKRFKIYAKLARARAQYLAHKHDPRKPDCLLGRAVSAVLIPTCFTIGLFVEETDWKALYARPTGRV